MPGWVDMTVIETCSSLLRPAACGTPRHVTSASIQHLLLAKGTRIPVNRLAKGTMQRGEVQQMDRDMEVTDVWFQYSLLALRCLNLKINIHIFFIFFLLSSLFRTRNRSISLQCHFQQVLLAI